MAAMIIPKEADSQKIREGVYKDGEFQILDASFWNQFRQFDILKFMNEEALYVLPTEELLCFLDNEIGEDTALEVGAGRGLIGRELNIRTTDSYQQSDILMKKIYGSFNVPVIKYPKYVEKIDAVSAARKYRPHTILGCFVTHKWRGDTKSGNDWGIDMTKMFSYSKKFILVGNKKIHCDNPLMRIPHREIFLEGLITRGFNPELNRVFIWEK